MSDDWDGDGWDEWDEEEDGFSGLWSLAVAGVALGLLVFAVVVSVMGIYSWLRGSRVGRG